MREHIQEKASQCFWQRPRFVFQLFDTAVLWTQIGCPRVPADPGCINTKEATLLEETFSVCSDVALRRSGGRSHELQQDSEEFWISVDE